MRFVCNPSPWSDSTRVDLLTACVKACPDSLPKELEALDSSLGGLLSSIHEAGDFRGEAGEQVVTWTGGKAGSPRVALIGLGESPSIEQYRMAGGAIARLIERHRAGDVAVIAHGAPVSHLVEGAVLGAYRYDRYLPGDERFKSQGTTVHLLEADAVEAVRRGELVAEAASATRDLINGPAELVTPSYLASWAQQVAEEESLEIKILDDDACQELGMGAFLGVSRGSCEPPQFIHLTYRPQSTPTRKIALVGKGVTFDSGGLDIKPADNMLLMKKDMSGAGTVLGVARILGRLAPSAEVHVITAATENMLGQKAYKPGDILRASNGKTIEVLNTDAEGRLTLADALVYASRLGVDAIVDLATLTGACKVALGDRIGGLFSSPDSMGAEVQAAAERAGEKVWPLPLDEVYWDRMKSPIADMGNIARSPGTPGATTAALFLKRFVEGPAWAHIDMSSPVWTERDDGHYRKGATGYAVATLIELLTQER